MRLWPPYARARVFVCLCVCVSVCLCVSVCVCVRVPGAGRHCRLTWGEYRMKKEREEKEAAERKEAEAQRQLDLKKQAEQERIEEEVRCPWPCACVVVRRLARRSPSLPCARALSRSSCSCSCSHACVRSFSPALARRGKGRIESRRGCMLAAEPTDTLLSFSLLKTPNQKSRVRTRKQHSRLRQHWQLRAPAPASLVRQALQVQQAATLQVQQAAT